MTVMLAAKSTSCVSCAGKTCVTASASMVVNSILIFSCGVVPSLAFASVENTAAYSVLGVSGVSGVKENVRASIHVNWTGTTSPLERSENESPVFSGSMSRSNVISIVGDKSSRCPSTGFCAITLGPSDCISVEMGECSEKILVANESVSMMMTRIPSARRRFLLSIFPASKVSMPLAEIDVKRPDFGTHYIDEFCC